MKSFPMLAQSSVEERKTECVREMTLWGRARHLCSVKNIWPPPSRMSEKPHRTGSSISRNYMRSEPQKGSRFSAIQKEKNIFHSFHLKKSFLSLAHTYALVMAAAAAYKWIHKFFSTISIVEAWNFFLLKKFNIENWNFVCECSLWHHFLDINSCHFSLIAFLNFIFISTL